MPLKNFIYLLIMGSFILHVSACKTSRSPGPPAFSEIQPLNLSGGSSGMEKLGDQSYLVVYDVKKHKPGTRMAKISITDESIHVDPIKIYGWGTEEIANDLESICKIPGRTSEYLITESGNWEGKLGRIFHVRVDTAGLVANILGVTQLPYKDINTLQLVGDQYESMACLPYGDMERILILAERGGSAVNPLGIVRWGIYNLATHQLKFSEEGLIGITVKAPGDWTDLKAARAITDLHIDEAGDIWASASEESGDVGPFYSVIYKLGQVDMLDKEKPFQIYNDFTNWKAVSGFKIEALSGPSKNIKCTHSFGTEDEIYGGVWRAIFFE